MDVGKKSFPSNGWEGGDWERWDVGFVRQGNRKIRGMSEIWIDIRGANRRLSTRPVIVAVVDLLMRNRDLTNRVGHREPLAIRHPASGSTAFTPQVLQAGTG